VKGVRNGEVAKTQAIRDALLKVGHPLTLDQIRAKVEARMRQIINKQKLYTLLSLMINAKELDSVGYGEDGLFYWFRRLPK
jgi:hypothetical protein